MFYRHTEPFYVSYVDIYLHTFRPGVSSKFYEKPKFIALNLNPLVSSQQVKK